jgi:hypothetical protein
MALCRDSSCGLLLLCFLERDVDGIGSCSEDFCDAARAKACPPQLQNYSRLALELEAELNSKKPNDFVLVVHVAAPLVSWHRRWSSRLPASDVHHLMVLRFGPERA